MTRDIAVQADLPDPPDQVWRALTDPDALAAWLMPAPGYQAVVGQRFQLRARPMPGWDGVVDCQVLAVDPPYRLVWSWRGSRMSTVTTVTWSLEARPDGGTHLTLTHEGFGGLGGAVLSLMHRAGWRRAVTATLPSHLAGQTTPEIR